MKAISEVRNHYEPQRWSVQILKVTDAGTDRWFFRHNGDKKELQRRFLPTNKKLQVRIQRKERWGHANSSSIEHRQ